MRHLFLTRTSFFALALLLCATLSDRPAAVARSKAGAPKTGLRAIGFAKTPPDFAFDASGGRAHLQQYLGTPVVLNFWATWCAPCDAELDAFARLRATYGERVPLLTISGEGPGIARAYLAARHIDATAIEDPEHKIFDLYSVTAIPVTLVLGRDGTVTHVSVGQIDWAELQAAVDPLLVPPSPGLTPAAKFSTLGGNAGTPAS